MLRKTCIITLVTSLFAISLWADIEPITMTNYYIDVIVHENNVLEVREQSVIKFNTPHHGYYRYVPLYFYANGGRKYYVKINNVSVDGDQYTLSEENDNLLIKIGDPDKTITGVREYIVNYEITIPEDRVDTGDLFYHSILGNDMEIPIEELVFAVVFDKALPKEAKDNLNVYSGKLGSRNNDLNAEVIVEGDTIYGYAYNIPQCNGLTLHLPLPEGYYVNPEKIDPTLAYISFGISIALALIIVFFAIKVKHPHITKQIEFYPPNGMCSAEVGTVIDDSADKTDLASLIPWFASQGYIKIEEKKEEGKLNTKTYLEITKLKPIDSQSPAYQRTFFNALFSSENTTVRLDKLPEASKKIEIAQSELSDVFTGEHTLTTQHASTWLLALLLLTSTFMFVSALPCELFHSDDMYLIFIIWSLPFAVGAFFIVTNSASTHFDARWIKIVFFVIRLVCVLIAYGLLTWLVDEMILDDVFIITTFAACFIASELAVRLNIDTPYRAGLVGKLLGLKEFIETAEKPRLESLLKDDPEYFYKILPYAMVFNISDIWADHFKDLDMEQPEWYTSNDVSNRIYVSNLVSNISNASNSAITCMSPSSSGSSSGGSSGGGSGGGGGGGW